VSAATNASTSAADAADAARSASVHSSRSAAKHLSRCTRHAAQRSTCPAALVTQRTEALVPQRSHGPAQREHVCRRGAARLRQPSNPGVHPTLCRVVARYCSVVRTPESTAMSTAMSKPASTPRPPGPIRMLARAGARPSTAAAAQPTPTRPPSRPSPCPRCERQHNRRVEIPRRPPRSYSATPVHPACKPLAPRKEHLQRAVSAPHTPTEQRPSVQWSNEGHGST
jgi:hypothetical protein